MKTFREKKGQMVFGEQMVLFFIVISALVAVTVYAQRGLQGRIRDARLYAVDTAYEACRQVTSINGQVCPPGGPCTSTGAPAVDCVAAAGNKARFAYEYEPYYTQVASNVERDSFVRVMHQFNNVMTRQPSFLTDIKSKSVQRPPKNQ